MAAAVGALELAAVGGAHDFAQLGHVAGIGEEEHLHAALAWRHLSVGVQSLDDGGGPWFDDPGDRIAAGIQVDTGHPNIATVTEFDADAATRAVDDRIGDQHGLIMG